MDSKTIVITGASGLLGRAVFSRFLGTAGKVIGTAFSRCATLIITPVDPTSFPFITDPEKIS